jgi:hypothetical protein
VKRSRISPISDKRKALNAKLAPIRKAYVEEMGQCAIERGLLAIECHEIAAGSDRHKAIQEPATWLAVSRKGHEKAQCMSKSLQLAYKLIVDSGRFDLEKFNAVYTGKESPVTMADVVQHLEVRE